MALIHTIQIANEKSSKSTVSSTRRSDTRKYLACLVTTTTEETIALNLAAKAKIEAELAENTRIAADLYAKLGHTPETMKAAHDAASKEWFDKLFAVRRELSGPNYRHVTDAEAEAVVFERHGLTNPYKTDLATLNAVERKVECATKTLDRWTTPVLGSQAVVSWHGTVGLAQKAAGAEHVGGDKGDTVSIRTDIQITETKKRGA